MSKVQSPKSEDSLKQAARWVRQLHAFALANGGRCYQGWTREQVFRYLAWHFFARNICVAYEQVQSPESKAQSPRISGFLIAWPEDAARIRYREAEGLPQFDWHHREPAGDSYILADCITSKVD